MTDLIRPDEGVRVRGLRRVEFEQMVEQGLFVGEPIELLGGELVEMSPQGIPHGFVITRLNAQLAPLMLRGYDVRVQLPFALDEVSLPEPDVAVTDRGTRTAHPSQAHALIEVAASSRRYDLRHKGPRYAAAGVPLYIVIDVEADTVIVHTEPGPQGYGHVEQLGPQDHVAVLDTPLDLAELLGEAG